MLDWIIGGGLLGLMGLILKNNKDYDDKVSRVYKRLDEVKENTEDKFTRKDICQILHTQINEKLDSHTEKFKEVNIDLKEIKTLVQEIRNNGKS